MTKWSIYNPHGIHEGAQGAQGAPGQKMGDYAKAGQDEDGAEGNVTRRSSVATAGDSKEGVRWITPKYYYYVDVDERKYLYELTPMQRFFLMMSDPGSCVLAQIISYLVMATILVSAIQFIGDTIPTFQ
jgi:hypothetical protein